MESNIDEVVQYFANAGVINIENFNQKVDEYKKGSLVRELQAQNAALVLELMKKEEEMNLTSEQQALLILNLTVKGVL
ncbi:hypothetical protein V4C29_23820 [Bacillus cereus]|jgi:hypothetical protein|uniref:hypothetical protein n=1 Tax=Bacillus cereus TaxID=1396 RepID=UPI002FE46604